MVRRSAIALACFFFVLFQIALAEELTTWLTYADGAAVLLALGVAALVPNDSPPVWSALWPGALGALMTAVAIGGFVFHASWWLTWFTLLTAGAFVGVALVTPALPILRAERAP